MDQWYGSYLWTDDVFFLILQCYVTADPYTLSFQSGDEGALTCTQEKKDISVRNRRCGVIFSHYYLSDRTRLQAKPRGLG